MEFPSSISLKELEAGGRAQVRFTLKNTGERDGWAVPQLYIHDVQATTVRRVRELKDFAKVFLPAGESRDCTLSLGKEELGLWDARLRFVVEPGDVELFLEEGSGPKTQGVLRVEG